MNRNRIVAALTVALIGMMMLATPSFAQKGEGRRGGKVKDRGAKVAEKLNLTQEQKDRMKASREEFRQQNAAALAEIKALREQLKTQLKNKDKEGAKATRQQIKAKMEALKPAREAMRQELAAILTPEQREQLSKMKEERKEKMKDRRKEWREKRGEKGHESTHGEITPHGEPPS